jgi:uncharacterized protein YqgV (UPF0045/DUF77 family)
MNLVSITRSTRGKSPREVTFEGIVTDVQSKDENGTLLFTKPRKAEDTPEPIMEPVNADTLPAVEEIFAGIVNLLKSDVAAIKRVFAKTYNAVAFNAVVEATATVVEDLLSPVFAELGITDEATITKLRRTVSMVYSFDEEKDTATEAQRKIEILRMLHAQSKR